MKLLHSRFHKKKIIKFFKRIFFLISIISLSVILLSCAAPTTKKETELVWPLPPEEPKIKWVGWLRGSEDVKRESLWGKLVNTILGEKEQSDWLRKPYGVHASEGRVFVSDTAIGKVVVFDLKERKFYYIGEGGPGILSKPIGIATDKEGNIYVTDTDQDRTIVYSKNGEFSHALGKKGQFEQPVGIAVNDSLNRVYIIDMKNHKVQVFSKQGEFLFEFGKRGGEDGEFNFPSNIFIDKQGKVYIADSMNFRVQIFNEDGKFLSKFGEIGDTPGKFARPKGIAVDSEGHIYVVDAAFNNVQIFDQEGQLLLFLGRMGSSPGMFWLPAGMYIDKDDKIYVADQYNSRINVFQYIGKEYKEKQKNIEETK